MEFSTLRIVGLDPLAILSRSHFVDPRLIVEIPMHRFLDASLKRFRRLPAEFALELVRIDGIAAIMSRSICHKGDLVAV